jgi:mono/diheme cytochrome c family protein
MKELVSIQNNCFDKFSLGAGQLFSYEREAMRLCCAGHKRVEHASPINDSKLSGRRDMKRRVVSVTSAIVAVVVASIATACGSSSSPTAPATAPTVTFSTQIQQQILTPACVACHTDDGRTPAGGLNLKSGSAHGQLVGVASTGKAGAVRVIAGNPSGSYLVQKLEGAADIVGLRMPRNGPPFLTDAQVALIRQWIQNGAPNN